jgi:hypothetical protein
MPIVTYRARVQEQSVDRNVDSAAIRLREGHDAKRRPHGSVTGADERIGVSESW